MKIYCISKKDKEYLTPEEREEIKKRFDDIQCSFAKDKDGYYCYTHRARSESYPSIADIPQSKVDFINSTSASSKAYRVASSTKVIEQYEDKNCFLNGYPARLSRDEKGNARIDGQPYSHSFESKSHEYWRHGSLLTTWADVKNNFPHFIGGKLYDERDSLEVIKEAIENEKKRTAYPRQQELLQMLRDRYSYLLAQRQSEEDKAKTIFDKPIDAYVAKPSPFNEDIQNLLYPNEWNKEDTEAGANSWYKKAGLEDIPEYLQRMFGLGKFEPKIKYRKCPKCGQNKAYAKEMHPDTSMNEMVLWCSNCGGEVGEL